MRCVTLVGSLLVALLATSVMRAETVAITSGEFSLAYGATAIGSGVNTWSLVTSSTPQASFEFAPAPVGAGFSGSGPTFDGVTIYDGSTTDVSGWLGVGSGFTVPITAKYVGPAPSNASPSMPNYQLALEITSLKVWASDAPAAGSQASGWMAWAETTSGHSALQDWPGQTTVTVGTAWNLEKYYTPVVWNPDDYSVTLAGLNDSYTRTFGARYATGGIDYRLGDGLVVSGRVHLTYNAVPEPGTLMLLATGLMGLIAYAWRKQK